MNDLFDFQTEQALAPSPKRYVTGLVDPPWQERGGGVIKRGADRHYLVLRRNRPIGHAHIRVTQQR